MLDIRSLHVKLGKHNILKDINLEIENGNYIIGLFGPNGAGKTTLINTLTGIINKYDGEINKQSGLIIAYLPDKPFLYGSMTLNQAMQYYVSAFHHFDEERAKKLFLDLNLKLEQKISQCSKGMLEQIHMILTICINADIYIFDEPLAAVDPLTRDKLIDIIKDERRENSVVLISTHLISDVEELFDDVIMIKEGKIILHDNIKNLKSENNEGLEKIFKERLR